MGAVSPRAQQRHSCHDHSLIKIDDGWLVFCPVSLRGKTLEMATSTIPWQSSAYSFLRDEERERIRCPGRTNQQAPDQFLHRHVFSQQVLQDPVPITGSSGVANGRRVASLLSPPHLPQQLSFPLKFPILLSARRDHKTHYLSLLSEQAPEQSLHTLRPQTWVTARCTGADNSWAPPVQAFQLRELWLSHQTRSCGDVPQRDCSDAFMFDGTLHWAAAVHISLWPGTETSQDHVEYVPPWHSSCRAGLGRRETRCLRNELTKASLSAEGNTRVTSLNMLSSGTFLVPKLSLLGLTMSFTLCLWGYMTVRRFFSAWECYCFQQPIFVS